MHPLLTIPSSKTTSVEKDLDIFITVPLREQGPCGRLGKAAEEGQIELETLARGDYPGRPLPSNVLPSLRSIGYWDARQRQNWGLDWHRHEGLEIGFLETGKMSFWVDGLFCPVDAGYLTITRPWQLHKSGNPNIEKGRLHWVILDINASHPNQDWEWPAWIVLSKEDLVELTNFFRMTETPVLQANKEIARCFCNIANAVSAHYDPKVFSRLAVYVNELLLALLEMITQEKVNLDPNLSCTQRTIELFLERLGCDLNELQRPWTVRKMAAECGVGTTQFTLYCKQYANMTPSNYLRMVRLETAKKLLKEKEFSIGRIAEECGFGSSEYFATLFRDEYHLTPSQWKEQSENKTE
ncbi:MAG: AraC family transcriptional regulator [Planctomycetia bacterium]|nr:AraC family transcriptional regulator [Planctomycetia bacterium]